MPSTIGNKKLAKLLGNMLISDTDFLEILEERRILLKKYLGKITLKELGAMEYLKRRDSSLHPLNYDKPILVGDGFSMKTQGLFSKYTVNQGSDNTLITWGLTRQGKWALIKIDFELDPPSIPEKNMGRKDYERATKIVVKECPIEDIIKNGPCSALEILREMENILSLLVEARLKVYEEAKELHTAVKGENKILTMMKKVD